MGLTLFCSHSTLVAHLQRENEWLRKQTLHERQRAEIAIDELLRTRVGVGPVSLSPREAPAQEDVITKMLQDAEFVGAGEVE